MRCVSGLGALCVLIGMLITSASVAAPMRCTVNESSTAGGTVEVQTHAFPENWPIRPDLLIRWKPPGSPLGPILVLGYRSETLEDMGKPTGGHIRFRLSKPAATDNTQVILSGPNGEVFILSGDDLGYGIDSGEQDGRPLMAVTLSSADADWPMVKSAIAEGEWLRVKLVRDGVTLSDTLFDLSNVDARDALLSAARRKIEAADRAVCSDGSEKPA